MEPRQKLAIAVLAAVALLFGAFVVGYSLGDRGVVPIPFIGGGNDDFSLVEDAFDKIRSSAVDPPSDKALARGAIRGMVEVLRTEQDPYAFFYTPRGYRSFQELTSGKFSGIGVWLKEKSGDLVVVSVLPSTPAVEAGVKRGDVITSIDSSSVADLTIDEAVALIKGPEGTEVTLGIRRGPDELTFKITRESIDLPNLIARGPRDGLAYFRLFGFARGAADQVRDEVERQLDAGAEGLILDLRDNGGGLFSEAIDVASVFIENGEIVTYRERSSDAVVYEAEGDAFEDLPLVVLVNEGTASASEIVAGALQDRDRAVVIGTTTYGKGSVQQVLPLLDSSALKLTIAAYFTPDGSDINGEGIQPDIEVDATPGVQKRRAIDVLRGIVISATGAQG